MKKVLLLSLFGVISSTYANVINFDDLSNGTVVTNQYASLDAIFSSTPGNVNYITTQPSYNGTPPNFLCTGPTGGGITCTADTIVTFATPVNGLTFQALGINNTSANVAEVNVYTNGVFASTVIIPGAAQGLDPELIDLSGFSNVTQIDITDITDGGGIGWDTFTFTPNTSTTSAPEPSTLWLFGSAAALATLRKFSRKAR